MNSQVFDLPEIKQQLSICPKKTKTKQVEKKVKEHVGRDCEVRGEASACNTQAGDFQGGHKTATEQ